MRAAIEKLRERSGEVLIFPAGNPPRPDSTESPWHRGVGKILQGIETSVPLQVIFLFMHDRVIDVAPPIPSLSMRNPAQTAEQVTTSLWQHYLQNFPAMRQH